jgi:hypothetical protein
LFLSLFVFVHVFAAHVILQHLVRADFPLNIVLGVFDTCPDFGLERVPFIE